MRKKRRIWKINNKSGFINEYYEKHKKTIDRAVAKYKEQHPTSESPQEIFYRRLYYGTDWNSYKKAKQEIDKVIYSLRGGDEDEWVARHTLQNKPKYYSSQTRLNQKWDKAFIQYVYEGTDEEGEDFTVLGYHEIKGSKYVVAKFRKYFNYKSGSKSHSPYEYWEWVKRDEIGL